MGVSSMTLIDNRDGTRYTYEILEGTRGPAAVDLRRFYHDTGLFTYDPGFTSTASCKSQITYIDGQKGELRYRGYPIEELAGRVSYLDVCYLLTTGKLPAKEESLAYDLEIRHRSFVHEGLVDLIRSFPADAHPMAIMASAVSALSSFYYEHLEIRNEAQMQEMTRRIIAKMPTLAAFAYRHALGIPLIYPDIERSFTENFLYMIRAYPGGKLHITPQGEAKIRDIEIEALDTIFTLHADHEQNASTTIVRGVASTGAHPYVAISAGISALWGRAHGGANESVIAQLEMIGDVKRVPEFIAKAKDKNDPFRLMGFGHRVYKNFDPRAKILKALQDQLRDELDLDQKLLEIAAEIERIALSDPYFIERRLYPNVDFYSGVILYALGLPRSMFTPVFVIGRTVGWITQWGEAKRDPDAKIVRPRQLYIGS